MDLFAVFAVQLVAHEVHVKDFAILVSLDLIGSTSQRDRVPGLEEMKQVRLQRCLKFLPRTFTSWALGRDIEFETVSPENPFAIWLVVVRERQGADRVQIQVVLLG